MISTPWVWMELCRAGGVEFLESLEAARKDKLFAFFGWEIAGGFDRDIDPIWSTRETWSAGGLQEANEAVGQVDFGNRKGVIFAIIVKILWGYGIFKRAKHGFIIWCVGLVGLFVRNIMSGWAVGDIDIVC